MSRRKSKKSQCLNCGGTDFKYYDGMLGYEAFVCLACGMIFDHAGAHEADTNPQSVLYIPVDHKLLAIRKRLREKAPEIFDALKEALCVLNQIPNNKIQSDKFRDSYEVCSYLGKVIREVESAGEEVSS